MVTGGICFIGWGLYLRDGVCLRGEACVCGLKFLFMGLSVFVEWSLYL